MITNRPSRVQRADVIPWFADHDIVHLEMAVYARQLKQLRRKIHLYQAIP